MIEKIQVKIVETRTVVITLDPENYPDGQKDEKGMFEIEQQNAADNCEYMDWMEADSVITIERVAPEE